MLWQSSAMKRLPIPGHPVTFRLDNAVQFIAMPATPVSVIAAHPDRFRNWAFMLQRARRAESSTRSHPPTSSSVKFFSPLASPASPCALTCMERISRGFAQNGTAFLSSYLESPTEALRNSSRSALVSGCLSDRLKVRPLWSSFCST